MDCTDTILELLQEEIPDFNISNSNIKFTDLSVDSFSLLTIRIGIEKIIDKELPDDLWVTIKSPADILVIAKDIIVSNNKSLTNNSYSLKRFYKINMPQMSLKGLSESWLLKEVGDIHWSMILEGLNLQSDKLVDGNGNRLYATFTSIKYNSTHPLIDYSENETITFDGEIARYGSGLFFSSILVNGNNKSIKFTLMSTFTRRGSPNTNSDLLKGQPNIPEFCPIKELKEMPVFGNEYRKKRSQKKINSLFETPYEILPYHDINGVGLLYFASYPIISDICEQRFMNIGNHWAIKASPICREIYYYGNCDLNDSLFYVIHTKEDNNSNIIFESSLSRASDGLQIASIITTKALINV